MASLETRIDRRYSEMLRREPDEPTDPLVWDWYAQSCPCGLPPGECPLHPRARQTRRPPEGDWRVWSYVAGRGAGKTRAAPAGSKSASRTAP